MEDVAKAADENDTAKETPTPPMPPLEAAARRLERSLGGGNPEKGRLLHAYANPSKVVRRWLGTASGTAGGASAADIATAASTLFDPATSSAGIKLLSDDAMDVVTKGEESSDYLTSASAREVECWLLSLKIRLLFKEKKLVEAFDLVQKSISIVLGYLEEASTKITSLSGASASSLFPLLARLYRYRSLVADEINDVATTTALRQDMSKAHNMACIRRDVDSQATLLNLMLRDLLTHSQSKFSREIDDALFGLMSISD